MRIRIDFVKSLLVFSLASSVFVLTAEAIRCYSCELSSSEVSYVDAEKRCNSRGPSDCQNPQHKACMTEAFTTKRESSPSSSSSSSSSSSFNVVKKCMTDCPVFVNSTAEHIRCCLETACNNLIFIETADESTAQPRHGRQLPPGGSPLPSPSSEDQSLPPPDNNEDEGPPSMMRPNMGGGRFPPPGPNDPGRRHAPPQLQQQQPGSPGGMRPPQPPPGEMGGDERQRHGGGGPGSAGSGGGRGGPGTGAGAGGGGSSSSGIKSASSRLSFPSLIQLVALVVASLSAEMMIIQK